MQHYFVRFRPPRGNPDLMRLAVFLWGINPDFEIYQKEQPIDDNTWVEQAIVHKDDVPQRVEIIPVQPKPLVVQVSGSTPELAARAANFITNRTWGRVSDSLTGPWRKPKSLHKRMGEFDVEEALTGMVMQWADVEQPPHSRAHHFSSYHRKAILQSELCGCYYCTKTFEPSEIRYWVDEWDGIECTALCPKCGIDSVIGSTSGYPIETEFLQRMHNYWFRTITPEIIIEMQSHGNLLG